MLRHGWWRCHTAPGEWERIPLDPVILILPQEFFRNCAILILAVLLAVCTALIVRDCRKK